MNEKPERQSYETPLLWANLKSNIIKNINESGLMFCEIEAILKDIYLQIQANTNNELQISLKKKEIYDNKLNEGIDNKGESEK